MEVPALALTQFLAVLKKHTQEKQSLWSLEYDSWESKPYRESSIMHWQLLQRESSWPPAPDIAPLPPQPPALLAVAGPTNRTPSLHGSMSKDQKVVPLRDLETAASGITIQQCPPHHRVHHQTKQKTAFEKHREMYILTFWTFREWFFQEKILFLTCLKTSRMEVPASPQLGFWAVLIGFGGLTHLFQTINKNMISIGSIRVKICSEPFLLHNNQPNQPFLAPFFVAT